MKFFSTKEIREIDLFTIEHEPILSINLMERAAKALHLEFTNRFTIEHPVCIFAGPGNNGGDALALARLLLKDGYNVTTYLIRPTSELSPDCEINRTELLRQFPDSLVENPTNPNLPKDAILIDGLFGSGLNRPLADNVAKTVLQINSSGNYVVAIDIPSGLHGEENNFSENPIVVKANLTLSFQFPKLAFLLPENEQFVGEWKVLDIGLHPKAIEQTATSYHFLEEKEVSNLLKHRSKFAHKGTCGHALIVAGSKGMPGAVILATKAALRSGAGLVTVQSASINHAIIETAVPEAISKPDKLTTFISTIETPELYDAIGIGPGIGKFHKTHLGLKQLLETYKNPCVVDADALNIIAKDLIILKRMPKNSILTPHPKEFDRLFGASQNTLERITKAESEAQRLQLIIILKGAYTTIALPDGNLFFNSTGNPGMATAGAGDVLTGILTGLMAQGYTPVEAAKLGVFLHGRAGDLALAFESEESLLAGDIIATLGKAFKSLR